MPHKSSKLHFYLREKILIGGYLLITVNFNDPVNIFEELLNTAGVQEGVGVLSHEEQKYAC